jgi:hypothetical protein
MYPDKHNNVDVIQRLTVVREDVSREIDFSVRELRDELASVSSQGSKIRFAPLSPLEKGFFTGVENGVINKQAICELYKLLAQNDEKKTADWINSHISLTGKKKADEILKALPCGLTLPRITHLQNGSYEYFEELKKQYKFYRDGELSGNYSLAHPGEEISVASGDEKSKATILFTIEGIHSLGIGNPEDECQDDDQCQKDVSIGRIKSRIRQIKGEESLEDENLKRWEHPPLLMRLAKHFGNGIFGHARSFSDCAGKVLDQKRYLDKGIVNASGYEIVRELLGLDEQLQPTGSRRILIDMTHLSASARNDLYQTIFRRFNKNISPEHPIPVIFTEAAYSGIDYLADMTRNAHEGVESDNFRIQNYSGNSINLSDEDILEVFWSKGLISFSLEKNRIGNEITGLGKLFPSNPRSQALRSLTNQIKGVISAPFVYNVIAPLRIWDSLNIGSGLSGRGEKMERYCCTSYERTLEEDLEEVLTRLKKEEPMWFGSYKPDALVKKICYQNLSEFVFRNF